MGGPTEPWSKEVWGYYDTCPEFGNVVMFNGNSLAKVRLFVAVMSDEGEPIPVDQPEAEIPPALAVAAQDLLATLKSPIGGQAEILRTMSMNLDVPGECYLVFFGERVPTAEEVNEAIEKGQDRPAVVPARWEVYSESEIMVADRTTKVIVNGDTKNGVLIDPDQGDDLFRIWIRHPRWSTKADSAARHCLTTLRLLASLEAQVLASTNSQMNSGILAMPNGMTFGASPVTPDSNEEHKQSPFEEALDESFAIPVESPEDLTSIRPMVVFGSREDIAAIKYIPLSRAVDDGMDERIDKTVVRLARGMSAPVEVATGLMQTTFANAEAVDQQTFDDYLEPRCRVMVDALTIGFLRPGLDGDEEQIGRLVVWYDPGDLIGNPDTEGAATEGVKIGAIGRRSWRRVMGFSESDAPDEGEEPPATGTFGDPTAPVAASGAVVAAVRATSPLGERLTDIDRRLYDRLAVAFSMAMERALDRAGARLRTRANGGPLSDLVASVRGNVDLPRHLGPALVADTVGDTDLLAGAWAALEPIYRGQVQAAQRQARAATGTRLPIHTATVEATQVEDLDEAWAWTQAELTAVTQRSMFEDIAAATIGEANPAFRSPAGLIRQSMARAGGLRGIDPKGADQGYLVTLSGSLNPAGGVATGTTIMDAATDAGATIDGYTWITGDPERPFEPHQELDGVTYTSYDDDVLVNDLDFPDFPHFFPFDHLGCICQAEPSLLGPDGDPI